MLKIGKKGISHAIRFFLLVSEAMMKFRRNLTLNYQKTHFERDCFEILKSKVNPPANLNFPQTHLTFSSLDSKNFLSFSTTQFSILPSRRIRSSVWILFWLILMGSIQFRCMQTELKQKNQMAYSNSA